MTMTEVAQRPRSLIRTPSPPSRRCDRPTALSGSRRLVGKSAPAKPDIFL